MGVVAERTHVANVDNQAPVVRIKHLLHNVSIRRMSILNDYGQTKGKTEFLSKKVLNVLRISSIPVRSFLLSLAIYLTRR